MEKFWPTLFSHIGGFSSIHCLFKALPQQLNGFQVRTLTMPLQNLNLVSFEPFRGEIALVLPTVVLLHNVIILELQIID